MAVTLILAKSITEANQYAKAAGLERFNYRAVRSAGSIRGVRHAEVHLLSSFIRRLDRHAIMAALRMARSLEVYYVVFEGGQILDGEEDPRGDLTDEVLEAAYAEHFEREGARLSGLVPQVDVEATVAEVRPENPDLADAIEAANTEEDHGTSGEAEQGEDAAPAEESKPRRRRSRCKDCGELHFPDEPCVQSTVPAPTEPAVPDNYFA